MVYGIEIFLQTLLENSILVLENSLNTPGILYAKSGTNPCLTILTSSFSLLGITVLGGENSKRLDRGIYVKSVTEGGAAWRDGRLKAGKFLPQFSCVHLFSVKDIGKLKVILKFNESQVVVI